ncbi:capsid maturation protease [Microbacterium phage Didgeridoo]|uniref:capsid maturation protease n=1 Tax=Microbacterium phage Didgeridoo TaxID=2126928 RepID=UPI000D21C5BE|nr:capsid maturation protease [Microbacterium phage Didgeridoo]YP_010752948.1 capsid maturation protease [Microbacterium phage IndyLu]AVR56674.1 capsid maturation protease [Microbacterium phage Didgeridoo]UDG78707.1 capsid maturation protease [Microbacterium phage IndyLu]WNO26430.1 capsid maturation protease [Microbacterium phage BabyDaisy]
MDLKSVTLSGIKTAGDAGSELAEGEFTAYVSTWTRTPDSYGDVVAKGAFSESIKEWESKDSVMPILFGHDLVDPFSNLGHAKSLIEDDHGLLVHAALDLENPKAKQVYRMLKGRRINQMSFAYDTLESGDVEVPKADGDGKVVARELRKLRIHEASVVPFGANSDTEVLAVKAMQEALEFKAGRTISAKNLESLETAYAALGAVIAAAKESTDNDDEASSEEVDKAGAQERDAKSAAAKSALAKMSFLLS